MPCCFHKHDPHGRIFQTAKNAACDSFAEAKAVIDDYMDYYNNDRGQWELLKLTPNEYYEYCITGIYPLISYNQSEKGNCPQEK